MKRFAFPLSALLAAAPAFAQDDSLYPDPTAPDASFLRVLAPEGSSVRIDGAEAEAGDAGLTAYTEIAPGTVGLTVGGESHEIEADANAHYTWLAGEARLIADSPSDSPAQAGLTAYNLTDIENVELYVPKAEAVALSGLAPGDSATVALKAPLTLDFTVRADSEVLATLEGVELRRGTGTSVILTPAEGGPEAAAVSDTYE